MLRLDASLGDFPDRFSELVNLRRDADGDVDTVVAMTIADVKRRGDVALAELTNRFDGFDLNVAGWGIGRDECKAAFDNLDRDVRDALQLAAKRIAAWHKLQLPKGRDITDSTGVRLGARWSAVDAAGVYVPGGRASYPSSVLMNVIPAKVAGVKRIAMMTPTPLGEVNQTVLAAAHIAGVDEIWRIGGAQAIAALAYGTERIAPVDVITGPGNAFVAEAKRQLYGVVGIDMVAGPSEIVVVADAKNKPDWIAADLLSQAEHDPSSQSILFTDDRAFADNVSNAVDAQLAELKTERVASESWNKNGAIIVVKKLGDAIPLVNRLAPEHLALAVDAERAEALFTDVKHAGSVFLGRMTPEAIGDYVAGPNHVLPTGRRARFSSGLSVLDFMKRTSFIALDDTALGKLGPAAVALAEAEGLPAHAHSVRIRL